MIVFHEGLPGSGKSYEAVLSFIVPALCEGKHVYTNIRGVDHVAIAQHLGLAPVFLEDRLHLTSPDATPEESQQSETAHLERQKAFFLAAAPNCVIVWDEVQDFFPSTRQAVSAEWSEFVAAHRHAGRHIVLMGQDVRDVHTIWRRRVEQLIRFRKLTMIGQGGRYRWDIYQNKGGDKWEKIDGGFRKYDKRVFALYQSVRGTTKSHALLKHDKANPVANSFFLRVGLPVFLVAIIWGVYTLSSFFGGGGSALVPAPKPAASSGALAAPGPVKTYVYPGVSTQGLPASMQPKVPPIPKGEYRVPAPVAPPVSTPASAPAPASDARSLPERQTDFLVAQFKASRAYVMGFVENADSGQWYVDVAFFDGGNQPYLRLDRPALEQLASQVQPHPAGLLVTTLDGIEHLIPFRAAPDRAYTVPGALDAYRRGTAQPAALSAANRGGQP